MISTMHRLDPELKSLVSELKALVDDASDSNQEKRTGPQAKISAREKKLLPIYHQIAIQFADDHDKPQRMLAKGVIRQIVPWEQSRSYFYNRLKRRMAEKAAQAKIASALSVLPVGNDKAADSTTSEAKHAQILELMITELAVDLQDDKAVADFLTSEEGQGVVKAHCTALQADAIAKQVVAMGEQDPKAILRGLMSLIKSLQVNGRVEERDGFVIKLKQGLMLLH
jgi:acetyl-CoA carboxylase/biotin carboxylase 1